MVVKFLMRHGKEVRVAASPLRAIREELWVCPVILFHP